MSKPAETDYGKGSFNRVENQRAYWENFSNINFGKKQPEETKPKVCLCSELSGRHPACPEHSPELKNEAFGSLGEYI